jgi:hypothetical protein
MKRMTLHGITGLERVKSWNTERLLKATQSVTVFSSGHLEDFTKINLLHCSFTFSAYYLCFMHSFGKKIWNLKQNCSSG